MPPLPGNIYKSEIDLGLPFMVPDLVYKFQMICFKGNISFWVKTKYGMYRHG